MRCGWAWRMQVEQVNAFVDAPSTDAAVALPSVADSFFGANGSDGRDDVAWRPGRLTDGQIRRWWSTIVLMIFVYKSSTVFSKSKI